MLPSANEVVLGRPLISSPSPYCAAAAPGTPGAAAADDDPVEDSVLFRQSRQSYVLQDVLRSLRAHTLLRAYVRISKTTCDRDFPYDFTFFCSLGNLLSWFAHTFSFDSFTHCNFGRSFALETHTREHTGVGWECFNTQCHLIYSNTQSHALFPFFTLFFGC